MATVSEDYVSFETAKLLKNNGFPQQRMEFVVATRDCSFVVNGSQKVKECAGTKFPYYPYSKLFLYEEDWAVLPTLQMTMKWLREVHKLEITPFHEMFQGNSWWYRIERNTSLSLIVEYEEDSIYGSYEQACDAAILYCLTNLI